MNARLLLVLLFVLAHTVTAATAQTTASGARVLPICIQAVVLAEDGANTP